MTSEVEAEAKPQTRGLSTRGPGRLFVDELQTSEASRDQTQAPDAKGQLPGDPLCDLGRILQGVKDGKVLVHT